MHYIEQILERKAGNIMAFVKNNENAHEKHNETINKKTGKGRLKTAAIISLILNLLAVGCIAGDSLGGGLDGLGYLLFFLIFGGISVAIDTIWLVRFITNHQKQNVGSKKLYALITVVLHIILLAFLARGYAGDFFVLFGILLIVCGVIDIIWIIHGIKSRYNNRHDGKSPKSLFIIITVLFHITAAVTAPMMESELFGVFIVFASICLVIDFTWLIIGGKSLSKRNKD